MTVPSFEEYNHPPMEDPVELLRRWSMTELLSQPDVFEWLVTGLLPEPTYGQAAGPLKSLKSYVATFISVGLAGGVPIFGHFTPPSARPVVAYVGEGGQRNWTRRLRRICYSMGVTPGDLPLYPIFDVAPAGGERFQGAFAVTWTTSVRGS
jgi:RecA-family ATPase